MEKFKLSENTDPNKIFIVNRSELEGRIDPYFYKNEFTQLRFLFEYKKFINIGDILKSWNRGDGPREGFYTNDNNGVFFLRVNNLKNNSIDLTDVKLIHRHIHERNLKRTQVKAGDLIFAISGTKDNLGTVSIIPDYIREANLNSALVRLDLNSDKILNDFFCILFDLKFIRTQIEFIGKGTAQNNLNNEEIKSIRIPDISIENQKNIIDFFKKKKLLKQQKEAEAQKLLDSIDDYLLGELGITLPKEEEHLPQNTDKNSSYNLDNDNPLVKKGRLFLTNLSEVTGKRIDPDYYSMYYKKIIAKIEKGKYSMDTISNNCINVFSGKTPSSSEYSKDNTVYPIIKVGSYTDYKIDVEKVAFATNKQPFNILKGDIFILSAAHQAEYVGKHIKYLEETPKCPTSFVGELLCIRVNEEKLLSN